VRAAHRTGFGHPITVSFLLILLALPAAGQRGGGGQRGGAGASTPAPAANLNLPSGDAKKGESHYLMFGCWECHGYTGQTGSGARLATTTLNASGFVNSIRNPRTDQMPAYSAKLIPDQEAADLFAYIKTFKKPPDAREIPLLQQLINEK